VTFIFNVSHRTQETIQYIQNKHAIIIIRKQIEPTIISITNFIIIEMSYYQIIIQGKQNNKIIKKS